MALHVDLRQRNTNTKYSLQLCKGKLSELNDVPMGSGTFTYDDKTFNFTKQEASGKIQIDFSGSGTDGTFSAGMFIDEALPQIGIHFSEWEQDIDDMLEVGTVYDLIPEHQSNSQTYPRYFISTTYTASSGRLRDIYTTSMELEVESQSASQWQSYTSTSGEIKKKYCLPLVLENALGQYIYGNFNFTFESWSTGYIVNCNVEWTGAVRDNNWAETDRDPGEKGFVPTGSRTKDTIPGTGGRPPGGNKIPGYTGDVITQPGAPDETKASAVGSGLIRAYDITEANLVNVGKCLYSSTLLTALANIFVNPLDAIISLNIFPYTPNVGSSEYVKLLNHQCTLTDLGAEASGLPLTNQFRTIDFGTVSVDENWGNFLDYSQTSIELYLPFIGSVELDVSECMNGTVNVQYTIDFFTGMCVANVLCEKTFPAPSGLNVTSRSQHSYQGNCAIQLPLTAVDYGSMIGSLIGSCATGLTNPAGGVQKAFGDAMNGGWTPRVTTKGNIVANAGFCSVLYPYIRLTRPITAEPESYQDVMGYPSYINTSLGQCNDLCVCDDIDLHTITGATPNELARIKQYCQNGVHV